MRALIILLVIGGILYGGYSGGMAAYYYFEISKVVKEVVPREMLRPASSGPERNGIVRAAVVKAATQAGINLYPDDIAVSEEAGSLWVRVTYEYAYAKIAEREFAIPISTAQAFPVRP